MGLFGGGDTIKIKIKIDSKVAIKGLDNIEKKLSRVGVIMNTKLVKSLDKMVRALTKMEKTAARLASTMSKSFSKLARAVKGTGTNIKVTTNNTMKLNQTLKQTAIVAGGSVTILGKGMDKNAKKVNRNAALMKKYAASIRWVGLAAMRGVHDIGRFISRASADIGKQIGGIMQAGGNKLKGIGSGKLAGNILSPVISTVRGIATAAISGVEKILQGTGKIVATFAGGLAKIAGAAISTLSGFVGAAVGIITKAGPLFGSVVGSTIGAIPKAIGDALDGVLKGVSEAFSGLVGLASGVFQAVVNVASQILNGLLTVVQKIVGGIINTFTGLIGKVAGIFGKVVGGAAAALATLGGIAIRQIGKMDRTLAKAFGLIPKAGLKAFKELRNGVSELARDIPYLSGEAVADGLFQAISAGARDPARALEIVKQSALAGVAGGLTDITEVVKSVTRVSAIFNEEIRTTTDLLFQTQNLGQLTFGELSRGIGLVAGITRTAKVELSDLLEVLAAGSRVLDAESLFTGTRRLVQTLAAPSPEARQQRKVLGIEFKTYTDDEKRELGKLEDEIKRKGDRLEDLLSAPFRGIRDRQEVRLLRDEIGTLNADLLNLEKASGKIKGVMAAIEEIESRGLSFEQIRGIIPEIRAAAVALGVQSLGKGTRDEIKNLLKDFKGAAEAAYKIAEQQLPARLSRAWGSFRELVRGVYDEVAGRLAGALDTIKSKLDTLAKSDAFKSFKESVAIFVNNAFTGIGNLTDYIVKNWDEITMRAGDLWDTFAEGVRTAWRVLEQVGGLLKDVTSEKTTANIQEAWEKIVAVWERAKVVIEELANGNFEPLTDEMTGLWTAFTQEAEIAWERVKGFALNTIADIIAAVSGMVDPVGKRIKETFTDPETGRFTRPFSREGDINAPVVPGTQGMGANTKFKTPSGRNIGLIELMELGGEDVRRRGETESGSGLLAKAGRGIGLLGGENVDAGPLAGGSGNSWRLYDNLVKAAGEGSDSGGMIESRMPAKLSAATNSIVGGTPGGANIETGAGGVIGEIIGKFIPDIDGMMSGLTDSAGGFTESLRKAGDAAIANADRMRGEVDADREASAALRKAKRAEQKAAQELRLKAEAAAKMLERLAALKKQAGPAAPAAAATSGDAASALSNATGYGPVPVKYGHGTAGAQAGKPAAKSAPTVVVSTGDGAAPFSPDTGYGAVPTKYGHGTASSQSPQAVAVKGTVDLNKKSIIALENEIKKTGVVPEGAEKFVSGQEKIGARAAATANSVTVPGITGGPGQSGDQYRADANIQRIGEALGSNFAGLLKSENESLVALKKLEDIPEEFFGALKKAGYLDSFGGGAQAPGKHAPAGVHAEYNATLKKEVIEKARAIQLASKEARAKAEATINQEKLNKAMLKHADEINAIKLAGYTSGLEDVKRTATATTAPGVSSTGRKRGFAEAGDPRRLAYPEVEKGRGAGIPVREGGFAAMNARTFGGADSQQKARAGLTKAEIQNANKLAKSMMAKGVKREDIDIGAIRAAVKKASQSQKDEIAARGGIEKVKKEELANAIVQKIADKQFKGDVTKVDEKTREQVKGVVEDTAGKKGLSRMSKGQTERALGKELEAAGIDAGNKGDIRESVEKMREATSEAATRKEATLSDVAKSMYDAILAQESADEKEIAALEKLIEIVNRQAEAAKKLQQRMEQLDNLITSEGGKPGKAGG